MFRFLFRQRLAIAVSLLLLMTMSLPLTMSPQAVFAQSATGQFNTAINSDQGPTGTQSTNIVVSSDVVWKDTGITLNVGDTLKVSATGSWSADPGDGSTTPDGYTQEYPDNFLNLTDIGVCATCASTPTPHWGALIGYIGNSPPAAGSYTSTSILPEAKKVFVVGSNFQSNATLTGELWFNFNDDAYSANTGDNAGQVTATVNVTSPSKPGGTWIKPPNGFTVVQGVNLHFAAHAHSSDPANVPMKFVIFRAWWNGVDPNNWYSACVVSITTSGTTDVYECDWNLRDGKGNPVPLGTLKVNFEAYDLAGNSNLSPDGIHQGMVILPTIHQKNDFYWSGYVTSGSTYSRIVGSWQVPGIHCNKGENSRTSDWVGFGGYNGNKPVEQTGSTEACENGKAIYFIWYEMYPALAQKYQNIFYVNDGDVITAEVDTDGKGDFTFQISSAKWSTVPAKAYSSNAVISSAEWIAEAPPQPYPGNPWPYFGKLTFFNCLVDNQSIALGPTVDELTLVKWLGPLLLKRDITSKLSNGNTQFSVTWYRT